MLNIKKIFEKIADAGQKILENKNLKRPAKKDLIDLCDELLSSKGAAFGITLATTLLILAPAFKNPCAALILSTITSKLTGPSRSIIFVTAFSKPDA